MRQIGPIVPIFPALVSSGFPVLAAALPIVFKLRLQWSILRADRFVVLLRSGVRRGTAFPTLHDIRPCL